MDGRSLRYVLNTRRVMYGGTGVIRICLSFGILFGIVRRIARFPYGSVIRGVRRRMFLWFLPKGLFAFFVQHGNAGNYQCQ